ncbi:hypothetical protein KUL25_02485 [Rhodobacteraceae bacterium N5(2021)]|uniref:Uncharacterized protein n=1 Tax=Gymnodinialimonas phycosphaerae TaxID=2841589 RepID=A0A975TXD3_9RHOB|nr:hypothetical protein [Gymnodinialimonas phycosphaerae]MBY4891629.1 hypothetical protein [Gymnodinialimonas phycosphaerae]
MTTATDQDRQKDLPAYEAPQLRVLNVADTQTGPFPDPSEFPTILQMS